jgi:hypothetical protein
MPDTNIFLRIVGDLLDKSDETTNANRESLASDAEKRRAMALAEKKAREKAIRDGNRKRLKLFSNLRPAPGGGTDDFEINAFFAPITAEIIRATITPVETLPATYIDLALEFFIELETKSPHGFIVGNYVSFRQGPFIYYTTWLSARIPPFFIDSYPLANDAPLTELNPHLVIEATESTFKIKALLRYNSQQVSGFPRTQPAEGFVFVGPNADQQDNGKINTDHDMVITGDGADGWEEGEEIVRIKPVTPFSSGDLAENGWPEKARFTYDRTTTLILPTGKDNVIFTRYRQLNYATYRWFQQVEVDSQIKTDPELLDSVDEDLYDSWVVSIDNVRQIDTPEEMKAKFRELHPEFKVLENWRQGPRVQLGINNTWGWDLYYKNKVELGYPSQTVLNQGDPVIRYPGAGGFNTPFYQHFWTKEAEDVDPFDAKYSKILTFGMGESLDLRFVSPGIYAILKDPEKCADIETYQDAAFVLEDLGFELPNDWTAEGLSGENPELPIISPAVALDAGIPPVFPDDFELYDDPSIQTGTRVSPNVFVWDWNQEDFCQEQATLLGFPDADLEP